MGTLNKNGDQKSHFGPHEDQSPQMGTNVGAVHYSEQLSLNINRNSSSGTLWDPQGGPRGSKKGPRGSQGAPENLWRTHLDPKSKKKCILFSSIFNVDRPFQRYLLKTSGPGENNPITKRKNNFFSKFPRCKISTSTFSEIGNKKKINGFGVWSGPFFLTWVHLKGSVDRKLY